MKIKFDPKFFGGTFKSAILLIVFFELVSFFPFIINVSSLYKILIFGLLCLIFAILSIIDIKKALLVVLAELFIGSQGYMFFVQVFNFKLSIRIAFFAIFMLIWLVWLLSHKQLKPLLLKLKKHYEILLLAGVIVWGVVMALIMKNFASDIFFDFNNWLYLLYILPFLSVFNLKNDINNIVQVLTASISIIAFKSFVFLYAFSHKLNIITNLYKWGRDTRWGEFTAISDSLFRVFSQAQIYVLIGFFIVLGYLIFKGRMNYRNQINQYLGIILFFCLTSIILSLSRSFWMALILSSVILILIGVIWYKYRIKQFLAITIKLGVLIVLSYSMITFIINFPLPKTQIHNTNDLFSARLDLNGAAVSSRWSQLPNLTKAITKHPIIGSGWGSLVEYQSQDPRIKNETNPNGDYQTFAFEWGYLDLMLKIGLVGVLIYVFLLWQISKKLYIIWQKNKDTYIRAFVIGLFLGLTSLVFVHGFTPYLNHPLGLGYIGLLYLFIELLSQNTADKISSAI